MAVTRIKNNQITDATVVANAKLVDYSISSAKLANNLTYQSNLTVTGNLTVQGNTTTIDTTITTIEDPVIVLASTQTTGTPAVDIGFLGYRGDQSNIAFVWDESADEFVTAFTSTGETNTVITITSYADFHTNNANIGGNLVVGGNISITGNVASLNVTGNITGGNLRTPGLITATGNVTGGNVLTAGLMSATSTITSAANITGGNLLTGGLISATSTITSVANITGGNLLYGSGIVSGTGNVYAANFIGNISGNIDAAGANTQVQFNDTGDILGASAGFTFDKTSNVLFANGNILSGGILSATGNIITSAKNIILSSTAGNSASANLSGIVVGSGVASFLYDAAFDRWETGNQGLSTFANVNSGNLRTTGILSATGNATVGNVLTGGLISATANITGGNILTAGLISATSTITSSANITGGNLLTGGLISATSTITSAANVIGGNISTAGVVTATGNVTGGNVITGGLVSATSTITSAANITGGNILTGGLISAAGNITGGNLNISGNISDSDALTITTASGDITLNAAGNISAGTNYINNVVNPTQDQDAATKIYVDNLVSTAISYHEAVFVATTGNLDAATGGTVTYAQPNGAANGIGATLTTTGSFNLIDAANVQSANTRILVKDQANAVQNGVYVWSNSTVITRSSDADTYGAGNVDALGINDYFYTTSGNVNKGTAFIVDAPTGTITFGTSNIQFAIFSQSQVYSANTSAGISLIGTVFSAKVDNNTTAFDGGGNISVKAGANLTTPNIGAATGTSLSVTANVTGGNITTAGLVTATGNVTGGNVLTGGLISATANVTGGNLLTAGLISATGTITSAANVIGGNITTAGVVTATGNIQGGNLLTAGLISATGTITSAANVIGGNITTAGVVTATGNIQGGNLLTGGLISATSNITGGNLLYGSGIVSGTGNVYATNFIGNISGNIDAGGANTNIQFNDSDILAGSAGFTFDKTSNAVVANGNITGSNFNTAGLVTATGNVTGGNVLTGGAVSATANITGGNLLTGGLISATSTITSAANVIGGNITTAGLVTATGNVTGGNVLTGGLITATGNITGANLILTTGIIDGPAAGRITINASDADTDFAVDGDTLANVFYVDAGTGTASFGASTQVTNVIVNFATTTSIKTPVGNTAQRPAVGVTGMLRFNTTTNAVEVYDNSQWVSVGVPVFTVIDDEQFNGDGSTVAFTLGSTQTTNSCIVSINGVVQVPTVAYSVSGTDPTCVLTFTEAPLSGDLIDVRQITTTTTVTQISNTSGNALIAVTDTAAQIDITGNVVPSANVTYDLGTTSLRWNDLYLAGNSIFLGNTTIKNTSGNTIGFFGPDGTTPATIDAASVDTTLIANGTSSVAVIATNGNIRSNVAGNTVQTISAGLVAITGDLSVSGNATLSGNILGDRLENGTTNIEIITPGGNANISVGGVSNVALFTTGGLTLAGNLTLNGNIIDTGALTISTGSNGNLALAPNGTGNVNITGNVMPTANATANIGSAALSFNTVFAKATSAQYADLAEKYTADAEYVSGTVVAFGGTHEVTLCVNDACSRVAGVISTNPSYRMNDGLVSEHTAMVALTGRVPTRVTGTVRKGDMMVSAGNGTARSEANPEIGTVIGKALADHDGADGVIEVVVGRV